MPAFSSALVIPDSLLANEATEILREHATDLLFNHSMRAYLFAAEQGRQQKLRFAPELLYIAAAFHDLGLTKKFSSANERFSRSTAQTRPVSSSPHIMCLKNKCKRCGKRLPYTLLPASRNTCAPKSLCSIPVSVSMCSEEASIGFLRSCATKLWPGTLVHASRSASSRNISKALHTSPPPRSVP